MAEMEIENQGRHDGEGFKELAVDLWDNKPLLIILLAGLAVVVYLIAKNRKSAIAAPGSTTPANPTGTQGTYLVVNDVPTPNVNVTVNGTTTTQSSGGTPPPVTKPPIGPLPPIHPGPIPGPVKPKPATRTVVVTPWPTQDSTLWGIAQHYGYGSNWQQIYNLNKSKIGSDPNLLHAGMVLTLP